MREDEDMWTWYVTIDREGLSDKEAEAKAREFLPQATLVVVAKKAALAYAPAGISNKVASIVAKKPGLAPGSVRLCWLEPWMEKDMREVISKNQERGEELSDALHEMFHKMTGKECPTPN